MKHLSDAEIQNYLEGGDKKGMVAHLERCPFCQQQVRDYRTLFSELGRPLTVTIPDDFPKRVAAKIESGSSFFDMRVWQFLIPVLALIAGLVFALLSTGYDIFKEIFGVMEFLPALAEWSAGVLSQINLDLGLLCIGLLSLLLLTAFDHFVLREQMAKLSFFKKIKF